MHVSPRGVYGLSWIELREFFDTTHHGGLKKFNTTHHISPTQPTWVGLG